MKTIPKATHAEAEELFNTGWQPDVAGSRTYWLHRTLAPVFGVSTARALERNRAKKRYEESRKPKKESSK